VCGGVTPRNVCGVVVGSRRSTNRENDVSKLDKDQLVAVLDTLAAGNVVARRWAMKILGVRRRGIFHQVLMEPHKCEALGVTADEMVQVASIPVADKELMEKTWALSGVLWEQYRKLIYRLSRNFMVRLGLDETKLPDLIGEATVSFLKSVRGYDDRQFSFSAYFGFAVKTDLRRYVKKTRGLAGANEKLLIAYQHKWQELATKGEPHGFEDVVLALGLSEKNRERLWGTLQEPTGEGDLAEPLARVVVDKSAGPVDSDLISAIGMVELSVLERDAWISRDEVRGLFPGARKTMRAVAVAHGVSPQAAAYAAVRANTKIVAKLRQVGYAG
jgi:hypothetical protein